MDIKERKALDRFFVLYNWLWAIHCVWRPGDRVSARRATRDPERFFALLQAFAKSGKIWVKCDSERFGPSVLDLTDLARRDGAEAVVDFLWNIVDRVEYLALSGDHADTGSVSIHILKSPPETEGLGGWLYLLKATVDHLKLNPVST